jgi:CDP-4-dehydro-6-deoxyglucose reductase
MLYQIKVKSTTIPSIEKTFTCDAEESLIDAGLRQAILLPFSCKNGVCGSCKGKVLQGEFTLKPHDPTVLTEEERQTGTTLLCCVKPKSDLEIEASIKDNDFPAQKIPVRVATINRVNHDVIRLFLQLPTGQHLRFRAGQYIDILLRSGERRSYSIANAPSDNASQVELHIRWMPGGLFTEQLFEHMKEKEILRIEGPLGLFYLREGTGPIILLASGTGFAPIQSILKEMIHQKINRPVYLYWGARRRADLYNHTEAEELLSQLKNTGSPTAVYVPVLSEASEECQWQGRTGLVHEAVLKDFPDLTTFEVYACGAPIMVAEARKAFLSQKNLKEENFFSDAFISKKDISNFYT